MEGTGSFGAGLLRSLSDYGLTAEGNTKTEILRCLIALHRREAYPLLAGARCGPLVAADYSGSLKYQR
jgi:hypothetical protein